MTDTRRVVLCAKSTWDPAIRREHALAQAAAAHGTAIAFLERPADIRDARRDPAAYLRALAGRGPRGAPAPGLHVLPTAVVVPGHRDDLSERLAAALLARALRRSVRVRPGDVVVATTPWQWPALAALPGGVRRCFDAADDWSALIPGRAARFAALDARIAAEADAVVAVAEDARERFVGADVTVVPNGVSPDLLQAPPAGPPAPRTLVYVGTLSPRFDAPLVAAALDRLPGWRLDLHGQCQYPGAGDAPGAELGALLARDDVRWHGVVGRDRLPAVLDAAAVALLPNRPALTRGQNSMKLYDYAARGRPVVTTPWVAPGDGSVPPHTRFGGDAAALAAEIAAAPQEPAEHAAARRAWVAERTWDVRWRAWSAAVSG